MDQRLSGSGGANRTSKLMFFWEDHKFVVILVSCLVLPFIFVPVWILAFLVIRVRNALGLSRQHTPSDELTDLADIPEQSCAERRSNMKTLEQVAFSVGYFDLQLHYLQLAQARELYSISPVFCRTQKTGIVQDGGISTEGVVPVSVHVGI